MGYDIHITRAGHWKDNAGQEISAGEWQDLVRSDPELAPDPENGEHAAVWQQPERSREGWFDWYRGNVYTTDPDEAVVEKALQIAAALDARVEGDDGRVYPSEVAPD